MSSNHFCPLLIAFVTTFDALTAIALERKRNRRRVGRAKKISRCLLRWSSQAPENFLGMHLLIEAEVASLTCRHSRALPLYVNAIGMLERQGSLCHTALANELCGNYMRTRNDMERAEVHFQNAVIGYQRWGADAKARKLTEELRQYNFEFLKGLT